MQTEVLTVIVSGIFSLITGAIIGIIGNRPKKEEASIDRINIIFTEYEKALKRCKDRCVVLTKENRILTQENDELRDKMKGGE